MKKDYYNLDLLGAGIIRQAIFDALILDRIEKQNKQCENKHTSWNRNKLLSECKDAVNFIETNRLEWFIETYHLPIRATYIRNTYKKIKKMGKRRGDSYYDSILQ